MTRSLSLLALVGMFVGARIQSAEAACASDDCWTGASTSADWFDPANWTAGVPTSATNIIIDQGNPNANPSIGINGINNAAMSNSALIGDIAGTTGAVTVSGTAASWTLSGSPNLAPFVDPLIVGGGGSGSLTITNGGAVTTTGNVGNVVIGFTAGGSGMVTVGSATGPLSTLTFSGAPLNAGSLFVGDAGVGTLIINQKGAVSGFSTVALGDQLGSQGTVTVNGGSLTATSEVDVGDSGVGTLTIRNGGSVTSPTAGIANFADSAGSSVTVTGTGSTWNVSGGFTVGGGDTGSLSILAGGTVNAAGASEINIGPGPLGSGNGVGTLTVDNGTLTANSAALLVGVNGGAGSTMKVQNGGNVVTDGGYIGSYVPNVGLANNGSGAVTVTGAGSLWDATAGGADLSSKIYIDNPTSTTGLAIQQGGQVTDGSGFVSDFGNNNTVNTVTVDGAGSKWTNVVSLSVGYFPPDATFPFGPQASTGAVIITNGGVVSAPTITVGVLPDGGSGSVDNISVSGTGSSLQASGTLSVGLLGTGNLTVSGGASVTSGTGIIGFSSAAPGSLNQTGLGPIDGLDVGANSVGTVLVTGSGSTWTTTSLIVGDNTSTDPSGTFTGIGGGTATGTLTVADGAAVSSTNAIQVALNAGSTGTINIGAADGQTAVAPGTISAPAIIFGAGTGTVVFNHTGTNYTFAIPIQGGGSVDVESGTTILTANNTYTGNTSITASGATLQLGDGIVGDGGAITGNVVDNGTFAIDRADSYTFAGTISGSGSLAQIGSGTLTLTGNNTYTGGTTLTAGTLVLGIDSQPPGSGPATQTSSAIGNGTLTFNGGTLAGQLLTNRTLKNAVQITSNGGTVDDAGGIVRFYGNITDAPSASGATWTLKSSSHSVAEAIDLAGDNTYSATTNIASGTIIAQSTTALSPNSAFLVNTGATLELASFSNTIASLGDGIGGGGIVENGAAGGTAVLTLKGAAGVTTAFSGDIEDGGTGEGGSATRLALVKDGASTQILSGTNSYSGGTTILGGELSVSSDANLGAAAGELTLNGGVLQITGTSFNSTSRTITLGPNGGGFDIADQANSFTVNQTLSGSGGLSKLGAGTLVLTGTNTYTGATTVTAGTLDVTGSLGNTVVTVQSGGALSGTGTIAGSVTLASGGTLMPGNGSPGTITVGSLTLSAGSILSYQLGTAGVIGGTTNDLTDVTGNLTINGGTLNVTDSGSFAPGVYQIIDYTGTLGGSGSLAVGTLPNGDTGAIQTAIPGEVNLVVSGATALTQFWDGTTMAGDGTIHGSDGTWNATNTNWTSASGQINATWQNGVAVFAGTAGTVTVAQPMSYQGLQFTTTGYTLTASGSGVLTPVGVAPINVGSGLTATIAAPITGSGGLQTTGTGTLVLSGSNTYTGATTINSGSTLALSGTGSIASSSGVADNGTFDISGLGNGGTSIVTLSGSGTVALGANALTLSNANDTFAGVIGGSGGLTLMAGTETLSGTNIYTGATTINGGSTLALSGTGSIASSSGVTDNGTFDISGLNNGGTSLVSLSGGGTVALGANTLTLSNAGDTFAGVIGGSGGLALTAGTETLTGTNTYTGGTTISAGTLQIGNGGTTGSIVGDVVDNGALVFNRFDDVTFGGAISGSGSLQQNSAGASFLILTGTNTYTGGTTVAQGVLQVGNGGTSGSIVGDVTVDSFAQLAFNRSDTVTFSGLISGAGSVAQMGPGTLILPNANSYTGGTFVLGGTLAIGNNNALGTGPLGMVDGATLAFTQNGLNIPNAISLGVAAGNVDTGANTETLSGVISGANDLTKLGSGTLILSANNTYTGPTNVNAGTLDVTGSIAASSLTTVASGAALTGNGTVGNLQISSGGTYSPGTANVPGTLSIVSGNLALASGSTYQVYVNPTTSTFASVRDTASLAGTAAASFAAGSYISKVYTIVRAGSVSGTFSTLTTTNLPNNFTASLAYDSAHAYLDLALNFTPPTAPVFAPLNVNQTNVATTLVNYFNTTGSIPTKFGTLSSSGLTQVDGEDATGAEHGAFELTNEFLSLMLDPFVYGRGGPASGGGALGFAPEQETSQPPDVALAYAGILKAPPKPAASFEQRWTVWGAGFGGSGTANGDSAIGSNNVTATTYGFAAGADYHVSPDTVLGFALAGSGTNWNLAQALGTGRSDAFQAGIYGTKYFGPAYLGAAFAFTNNWFTTNRTALGDELTANFQGQSFGVRVEGGYRYAVASAAGVTPYAAIQAQSFHTPSYSETDLTGGGFGLSYNAMSATDTRSELGARFDALTAWGATPVQLRACLGA